MVSGQGTSPESTSHPHHLPTTASSGVYTVPHSVQKHWWKDWGNATRIKQTVMTALVLHGHSASFAKFYFPPKHFAFGACQREMVFFVGGGGAARGWFVWKCQGNRNVCRNRNVVHLALGKEEHWPSAIYTGSIPLWWIYFDFKELMGLRAGYSKMCHINYLSYLRNSQCKENILPSFVPLKTGN